MRPAFPKPVGRKGKRKKARKGSRRALIRKLDQVFSLWVRERDGHRCVTCGASKAEGALIDAGHYVSRRCLKLRWDPRNCHAQCAHENRFQAGAGARYAAFILRTYGPAELERLDRESRETWKPTLEELRALLQRYQGAIDG